MENKKLIKRIKKEAIKQFEADLKNSVLKELYGSASKKQVKKLRNKILGELQDELFGTLKEIKMDTVQEIVETIEPTLPKEMTKREKELVQMQILAGIKVPAIVREQAGIVEQNFSTMPTELASKFTGAANAIVNGVPNIPRPSATPIMTSPNSIFPQNSFTLEEIMGKSKSKPEISMDDMIRNLEDKATAAANKVVVTKKSEITTEKKEELAFFIEKLREGVSKLRIEERNINFRNKSGRIYNFSFERKADFDLKFDVDLDTNTYRATIHEFIFNIDGFNFDKKSFELLDIVEVLDLVGFNVNSYINEINGVNSIDMEQAKTPTTKVFGEKESEQEPEKPKANKKSKIRSNTKIEKFIDDSRIVAVLHKNDISNYGQLKSAEESGLRNLKGVGGKTADALAELIKETLNN